MQNINMEKNKYIWHDRKFVFFVFVFFSVCDHLLIKWTLSSMQINTSRLETACELN